MGSRGSGGVIIWARGSFFASGGSLLTLGGVPGGGRRGSRGVVFGPRESPKLWLNPLASNF